MTLAFHTAIGVLPLLPLAVPTRSLLSAIESVHRSVATLTPGQQTPVIIESLAEPSSTVLSSARRDRMMPAARCRDDQAG
jgi:hypothetical protein